MIRIKAFKGQAIQPYIQKLAEMRVKEFFNFPYLYVGTVEEDAQFSEGYGQEDNALLIVAFNDEDVIGLYSGVPFSAKMSFLEDWKKQASEQGLDLSRFYYAGEVILEKKWRNQGILTKLMNCFFKEVADMNYANVAAVTVNRPRDHLLRPINYQDTEKLWPRFGAQKTNITLPVDYPTRQQDGSVKNETNLMSLWVKSLMS